MKEYEGIKQKPMVLYFI